jgi:hypothetical protein
MTAQISDRVIYREQDYQFVGAKGSGLPHPVQFGLTPKMMSTACYRGFYCDYTVRDDRLLLTHLVVRSADDHYPIIDGVEPLIPPERDSRPLAPDDPVPTLPRGMYVYHRWGEDQRFIGQDATIYQGLKIPAPYTGGLLLARGFIQSMYVHMGFQKPTSFETVHELIFEEGKLISATDHSAKIAELRDEMQRPRPRTGFDDERARMGHIADWIAWTFSLDYDV